MPMAEQARQAWLAQGHQVKTVDLYQEGLIRARAPAITPAESRWTGSMRCRSSAIAGRSGAAGRRSGGIELLCWADTLVLQFPFWWFGAPAIIKAGWIGCSFTAGSTTAATAMRTA